ncbi:MAG: hypothetical protein O2951_11850 [Bacteroidetes bacterium]|nr:hypothetical protein [Bacteroidota bacterium]
MYPDFYAIVTEAWEHYDGSRKIISIKDISAKVSTNHVFKLVLGSGTSIIGKLSYFGKYDDFLEDHTLINALANNLPDPYDNFLSKSLLKKNQLYTYRHRSGVLDVWVVFYNPIKVKNQLPKILDEVQIGKLGTELAKFHKTCATLTNVLPSWSKTMQTDIMHLLEIIKTPHGQYEHRGNIDEIRRQAAILFTNLKELKTDTWTPIPVFVDWNIGNFSIDQDGGFYSRWDYDWFRMSSRVMDFYFFSRVCSSVGDKSVFSYLTDPMMEDRFILFLKKYHEEYPLTREEIIFFKEAYRFFILNYVVKDGRYFFHEVYATRLQREAFEIYFPQIDNFNPDKILASLDF